LCCCSEAADVIRWKGISIPCQYFPFSFDQKSYEKIPLKESPKEFIIGYMGRLSEEKGLKDLVAAVEKLVSEGVNIKLHLAGGGPLTESLKNHPNIQYYGILKHAEAHKFYKKIDLFVLPSLTKSFWKEQFGRVIVESVASGRPVLGSSSGAIPEVLGHLELPYVFKEGDVNELVSKIRMVMKDYSENRMQKVISKAYELDHQKFSNESVAKRMNTYAGGNSDEGRV
jgi:glycosyltransferase involved in cell wall biosynthesis